MESYQIPHQEISGTSLDDDFGHSQFHLPDVSGLDSNSIFGSKIRPNSPTHLSDVAKGSVRNDWVFIDDDESHVSSVSTPVTLFYNATHTVSAVKQAITELAEDTLALAFSRLRIHPLRRRNRSRYASISDPQLTDSFLQNSTYSDTHSSVISLELQREAAEGGDNQIMKMLKRRRLSRERKGRKNWLRFAPIVKSRMEQWRKENKGGHEDLEWSVEEGEEEEEEEGELATKAQEVEVTEEEFTIGEGALDIESDCSQIQRPFQWEWEMRSREY